MMSSNVLRSVTTMLSSFRYPDLFPLAQLRERQMNSGTERTQLIETQCSMVCQKNPGW